MTEPIRILITDDEETYREILRKEMERKGHSIVTADSGSRALEILAKQNFDVVLLDLVMPGMDGIGTLRRIREEDFAAEVVMLTGQGTIASAVEAMRMGAYDYLTKPAEIDAIETICRRAADKGRLARENRILRRDSEREMRRLLGDSPAIESLRETMGRAARSEHPVLILGESGTGKELMARAIHAESARASLPLVTVNCASLNAPLLESELFGHEKGAFTGAVRTRSGLFETADGGTIFLDEIGDMGLDLQARLLRTLQFGEVRRVGSDATKTVDVRVIAATHRDLEQGIHEGAFRQDLYYRLQTLVLRAMPLRERRDDIAVLAKHFLERAATHEGRSVTLTAAAHKVLERYDWPGNVRELENVMNRLVILCDGDRITETDIVSAVHLKGQPAGFGSLSDSLEGAEKAHIARILSECKGKKKEAAEKLGVSLKTLYNKLQKHGL